MKNLIVVLLLLIANSAICQNLGDNKENILKAINNNPNLKIISQKELDLNPMKYVIRWKDNTSKVIEYSAYFNSNNICIAKESLLDNSFLNQIISDFDKSFNRVKEDSNSENLFFKWTDYNQALKVNYCITKYSTYFKVYSSLSEPQFGLKK